MQRLSRTKKYRITNIELLSDFSKIIAFFYRNLDCRGVNKKVIAIRNKYIKKRFNELPDSTPDNQRLLADYLIHFNGVADFHEIQTRIEDDEFYLLVLATYLYQYIDHKSMSDAIAQKLVEAVYRGDRNEELLGRTLAWLPVIQSRYQTIPPLARVLTQQGKYMALTTLYKDMINWPDKQYTKETFIRAVSKCFEFLIRYHYHLYHNDDPYHYPLSDQLKRVLQLYMVKINKSRIDAHRLDEVRNRLIMDIHNYLPDDLATELHEIIDRYATHFSKEPKY